MKLHEQQFGNLPDGRPVKLFTLENDQGLMVRICEWGAIVTEIQVPDRSRQRGNVVLGFDTLEPYLQKHPYFGAVIGRVANRIAHASFSLDGKQYTLAANDGPNHLHGGVRGFDKVLWRGEPGDSAGSDPKVTLHYLSPDGEEGYPGNLSLAVTYALTSDQGLRIDYIAKPDRRTPINLTNHSYFNLAGAGDIRRHVLQLEADFYTPGGADLVPTGEVVPVHGTPMDFRQPTVLGSRFGQLSNKPVGYDHNFGLRRADSSLALAARVEEPTTGRSLEVLTTEPGLQVYTGNFLDGTISGRGGVRYEQYHGFCLETQHFPDAVHHSNFPSIIVNPGATYRSSTVYRFGTF